MPITGTGSALGAAIANAILATQDPGNDLSPAERQKIIDQWSVISTEIINHFVANTAVNTNVTTVVTGSSPAGPVTGTGVGPGVGVIT